MNATSTAQEYVQYYAKKGCVLHKIYANAPLCVQAAICHDMDKYKQQVWNCRALERIKLQSLE